MTDERDIEIARLRAAIVRMMHCSDHRRGEERAEWGGTVSGEHASDDELIAQAVAWGSESWSCCSTAGCACNQRAIDAQHAIDGANAAAAATTGAR